MTGARRVAALILLACVFVMEGYDLNAMALAVCSAVWWWK